MTPRHAGLEVADRTRARIDVMKTDAQTFAEHAARIVNAAVAVDGVADGQAVNQVAVFRLFDLEIAFARTAKVGFGDFVPGDGDLDLLNLRIHLPAREIYENPVDTLSCQFLGGTDGCQDGVLSSIHIDNAAVADTRRCLLRDADYTDAAFGVRVGDETACLCAADIERGDYSCAKLSHGQTVSRFEG